MNPTFILCYTTIRSESIKEIVHKWMSRAANPERVKFSITTDSDKAECIQVLNEIKGDSIVVGTVSEVPSDCVKGWNKAAEISPSGEILLAVADDFDPPENWDKLLESVSAPGWWDEDKVVHVWDGYNPDIFTLAILTRKRYDRFGYIWYPGYQSMFCDTEFTQIAKAEKCVIEATHLLFEHLHPDCGKRERDSVDLAHSSSSRYETGRMLFEYRLGNGFPLDAGPMARSDGNVSVDDLIVYVQAIKDDFCLKEVCDRFFREGIRHFAFYIPDEYWSGSITKESERSEVIAVADHVRGLGSTVFVIDGKISSHRKEGRRRIDVETSARNEALDILREKGYHHIVVADGDELWRKGLVQKLLDVVNSCYPSCVYTGMVPVVGLPGFPVHGAKDKATVYVHSRTRFNECRGVAGFPIEMEGFDVIHFTATRRTKEEIIQKSRDSGHYDDPAYDFEGWISNVLPRIRPGMRNVHMYVPYNPWPMVRHWSKEELDEIPDTIKPYLGIS